MTIIPGHPIPKLMTCCQCGQGCVCRQWWNRDTGFGICGCCADGYVTPEELKELRDMAGERGVHFDIPADQIPETLLGYIA